MDLENHRKHSFSNRMRSGIPESLSQCPGPFSVLQGQMQPRKTSRSERCQEYCFRSFQNRCMYIGKAAKVATMHNPDVFMVAIMALVGDRFPLQTINF